MEYLFIDYDEKKQAFVSREGMEASVFIVKDPKFNYYLHQSRKFIVKLIADWIHQGENIGEVIDLSGNLKSSIPNPGDIHGEFSVGGMVSGNDKYFKIILTPRSNGPQYFIKFFISDSRFEEAGLQVR